MTKREYVLDGARFDDLEGFYAEVSRVLLPGVSWGRNLDAFNDVLRGGFGTPEGGFVLVWRRADRSRRALGHAETARRLERRLAAACAPGARAALEAELAAARAGRGPTLFDLLLEIVGDHGPGGGEAEDGVELRLE